MSNSKIKKVAMEIIKKSGKMLLREYKDFNRKTVKLKSLHEILTRADLKSEEIIISAIKNNFPAHQILSEEQGQVGAENNYLWIIDPIDGTTNFSMHNPLWSISLAVAYKAEIVLGFIYAPVLDELYIAETGQGAKLNNPSVSFRTSKTILVSDIKEGKVLNTFCHGSTEKDMKKAIKYYTYQKLQGFDCRQLGSAALELAYVASGRVESIMIPGANSWDIAAGALLVKEAGGMVTDFFGQEWGLDSVDILASNGKVHREILRVINNK
jgi:myo-inositol-1(or 4)-monophosphatase